MEGALERDDFDTKIGLKKKDCEGNYGNWEGPLFLMHFLLL
jgi:hypothetical protein